MNKNRRLEILGILIVSISVFILISLIGYNVSEEPTISPNVKIENPMGILGVFISHFLIKLSFGFSTITLPIIGIFWGWFLFSKKQLDKLRLLTLYSISAMILFSISMGVFEIMHVKGQINFTSAGLIGGNIALLIVDWLSFWGSILLLISCFLILFRSYFDIDYHSSIISLKKAINNWKREKSFLIEKKINDHKKYKHTAELKSKLDKKVKATAMANKSATTDVLLKDELNLGSLDAERTTSKNNLTKKIDIKEVVSEEIEKELNIEEMDKNQKVNFDKVKKRKNIKEKYYLPSSELLNEPMDSSNELNRDELINRADYLSQSLSTYGVEGKVVNVHPGPVITLFEIEPAEGVRVNKFVQLADDLARVMEASSVRVIAPIPGKSSVGIELPNLNPATVFFKSVVNSPEFAKAESLLTLAIGKNTTGGISTLDLAKMPHLLIAGTTGSGKSVCINTIICSILYRSTPEEVKFVMIDPKKVEMTLYRQLEGYHLLKMEDISEPIVTNVENAVLALRSLEKEMDRRYTILADALVRNISEYNEKMQKDGEEILPYIVLVVDELADLMMLSAKDVEAPIARLAQLARAVGIHLVIATQRPSVDVITGVIKANFPSRIAFQVASKIDSRTIIDQPGADKLIGRGDMLHLGTGNSDVFRMHNAFLSLDEIESIMNHIISQPKPHELVLPSVKEPKTSEIINGNGTNDEMINEAITLVVTHQQGSISLLQRRLKIGYSRAARLIDEMEQIGVVGPFTGSKAREVLVDETYLEMIND